ncbi:MAG: hypothetical protein JJU13_17745 [Balneolaceae bacterium]|nr:hypothetical protein [Balneolaceae bacterium]
MSRTLVAPTGSDSVRLYSTPIGRALQGFETLGGLSFSYHVDTIEIQVDYTQ